jgi:hypothetical protein
MLNIQIMCMLALLANFSIPTLFCWSVPARLAGVLDLSQEIMKADKATNTFALGDEEDKDHFETARKRSSSSTAAVVKQYLGLSDGTSGMV